MAANQYKTAFGENINLIGLASVAALSAATLNPMPLLAGLVAEAAYLLVVPDTAWYRGILAGRHEAEVEAKRQALKDQVLPQLPFDMQARYERLESVRLQILAHPAEDQEWFGEVIHKLDYLLEKFLLFADKQRQFVTYLQSVVGETRPAPVEAPRVVDERSGRRARRNRVREDEFIVAPDTPCPVPAQVMSDELVSLGVAEVEQQYDREIADLKRQMEAEADPNTKAVIQKRADVLQRRREFVGRIGSILTNLNHQLGLVEDTFGLISDEIRARSPEQILADIEDVVTQAETMTQVLDEMAPYEQLAARLGS